MQKKLSPISQKIADTPHQAENIDTPSIQHFIKQTPPIVRLLVLIPDVDVDEERLGRKLWGVASEAGANIVLLSRVHDIYHEAGTRLRLETIAAISRDESIQVEIYLSTDGSWEKSIRAIWQSGDLVICQSEEYKWFLGIKREPLSVALASSLKMPVYTLTGFYQSLSSNNPNLGKQIVASLPLVAIFFGFSILLTSIQQIGSNWLQTFFLCFSVVIMYSLILINVGIF